MWIQPGGLALDRGWCDRTVMESMRLYLRELRKELGLTQQQLGGRVNKSGSAISQLERQHHGWNWKTIKLFADALGVPWYRVFGYNHPPDESLPEDVQELLALASELDPAERKLLIDRARFVLRQRHERGA